MGNSPVALRDFRRWFERHQVVIEPSGRGSHLKLTRKIQNRLHIYIIATESGRRVKWVYVEKARKALKLTADDGFSDDDFFS